MSPAPVPRHQDIVLNLGILMRKQPGKAYVSPIEVVLDEGIVLQPDVVYLKPDSRCEVGTKRLHGAPDLVVEVLSAGTAKRDRKEKFDLYEKHGVAEYWLVDPDADFVEVWRQEDEHFARLGVFGADEVFGSTILGVDAIKVTTILGE